MNCMSIVTLTTDFGQHDWFVGVVKGVLLGINPELQIVDITHCIPPGDIHAGAFALAAAASYFPKETVHVTVVDPGVGSSRPALAARTRHATYIGPDNGVLSLALAKDPPEHVHHLENPRYFLASISRTFHGRDIFAPVAAHLTRGAEFSSLGPEVTHWERLSFPEPRREGRDLVGEVVYIDRFGNGITNLPLNSAERVKLAQVHLRGRVASAPLVNFYQSVPKGELLAVPGST